MAWACDTGEEFEHEIRSTLPEDGATEVPLDGLVALHGIGLEGHVQVEVTSAGLPVAGTLEELGARVFWHADAELEPLTMYEVHAWTDAGSDEVFSFTTGTEVAAVPTTPELVELRVSAFDKEYTRCVSPPEPGDCSDCGEEEVIRTERRLELEVRLDGSTSAFGPFVRGSIRHGIDEEDVEGTSAQETEWWIEPDAELSLVADLGLVEEWESDEVCVRAWVRDPLERASEAVVECIAIEIEDAPMPDPADGDSEGSSGSSDADPDEAADEAATGCACRSSDSTPASWHALLAFGLLLRRRTTLQRWRRRGR